MDEEAKKMIEEAGRMYNCWQKSRNSAFVKMFLMLVFVLVVFYGSALVGVFACHYFQFDFCEKMTNNISWIVNGVTKTLDVFMICSTVFYAKNGKELEKIQEKITDLIKDKLGSKFSNDK